MDKRPLRVGLVFLSAALALAAMLLTGCGGSDDRAKVEASLQQHVGSLNPENAPFPIGSGPPLVQKKSCKDRHVTTRRGQVHSFHSATAILPGGSRFGRASSHSGTASRCQWTSL